ncbi:efflux RND transporter periplasmic adaptor subunit [Ottowia sp. GY511]|uniref:Efflux RND transporter periplasmic adaptor subunit n=1 Tax=Ottowia flava TaxID=2675430 RepID=A0ABW4KUX4_9BURK|nr:efflux RND transporter periplasmic adaptor subunit [Ottowia sp. GY511]
MPPYAPSVDLHRPARSLVSPALPSRSALWALGPLVLGLGLGMAGCGDRKQTAAAPPPPPEVGVLTLAPRSQAINSELPGRTAAFMNAEVRPQVNGIVQKRLFTEGSQVKAGQVLYQIDPSSYRAALASAKATLSKTQAAARTARVNAERNAELVKIDAVSRQVAQESQAQAAQSQADVAGAQAAVEAAQINLDYTQVKAPIAGRVNLSSVTAGALVTANQAAPLTTIVQLDPMYVDFTQSTAELLGLRRDIDAGRYQGVADQVLPVKLVLEDGTPYPHQGKLAFSGLIVNPGTGGVTLRAAVPNPGGVLMPGMYVRAQLPVGVQPQALLIPQKSVVRDPSGRANVWVVGADDKVERRPVTLAQAIGSQWMVEDGLKSGDRIVVDGFQRVRPGIQVKPVAGSAGTGPATAASGPRAGASAAPGAAQGPAAAASAAVVAQNAPVAPGQR